MSRSKIAQVQRSSAAVAARARGIFDVANSADYCLASSSISAPAAAVSAAADVQLVSSMEALLQVVDGRFCETDGENEVSRFGKQIFIYF
jgi:hypothetical protein